MRLRFQQLEPRMLLAADWHNSDLACDVDDSSLVTPIDALIVINSLNRSGPRSLGDTPRQHGDQFLDVNADGNLSPLDALLVINAINRNLTPPNLVAAASVADDPNFNRVVLQDDLTVVGFTSRLARLDVHKLNELGQPTEQVFQGNAGLDGRFEIIVPLVMGDNAFEFKARDELGRYVTVQSGWTRADVVADWNATMLNAVRDWTDVSNDPYQGRIVPSAAPVVARNLAMMHVAMFDASNAVNNQYESYLPSLPSDSIASEIAAVATAAHRVASYLYAAVDELPVWDATLAASLALVPDDESKSRGVALGEAVAAAMLANRESDGASSSSNYVPSTEPGRWNRTSPDFTPPLTPHWRFVEPFTLASPAVFRPASPPALDSVEYALAVDEVMQLGRINSEQRTAEQTEIAVFWADGAGTATPPGHWNRIATNVLSNQNFSLLENARVMALLNLALADAGIAAWDSKYEDDFWRPIDAIRRADEDGNSLTVADPHWNSLLKAPPHPSFVSGHSTFSGAGASVLTTLLGESVTFSTSLDPHSGLTQKPLSAELIVSRSFDSFWDAANEAGMSRIYGGIHYGFDNTSGLTLGDEIGRFVVGSWLRPK